MTLNRDWHDFVHDVIWVVGDGDSVEVGEMKKATDGFYQPCVMFIQLFPTLHRLLLQARITEFHLNGERFLLYGWTDTQGNSFGWQSPPPSSKPNTQLHEHHRILLQVFGGVMERWHEQPDKENGLLNLNFALTEKESKPSLQGWETYLLDVLTMKKVMYHFNPKITSHLHMRRTGT